MTVDTAPKWPELPLADWRATYATLHMWSQIVGKTRLALAPMENHWWQVTLYLTARGLTTSAMPHGSRSVEVQFDFVSHQLLIQVSDGSRRFFSLTSMTVADFFAQYMHALHELGIDPAIYASPVEVITAIPFAQDHEHATYQPEAAHQCWLIFLDTQRVMKTFRGAFTGKQSPVHFFWGSFDLAMTRFSGRRAPERPGADHVTKEAYSHEVSSVGWWPGDPSVGGPAFYSYAAPAPPEFSNATIGPAAASYNTKLSEFVLMYDDVRSAKSPRQALLDFCQSTYEAAATLGKWNRSELEREESN
jgi:uncharacterized protein DUF5996